MICIILEFSIVVALTATPKSHDLSKVLKYYETLKTTDFSISVRKPRSIDVNPSLVIKHISFYALGRNFNLILKPGSPILAPDFQAKFIYADGRTENITINKQDFFTGHLAEDDSVHVDAFYEGDVFCTSINFPNETYVTEPSWRHLQPSSNHSVIAYRASDLKWDDFQPFPEPISLDPVGQKSSLKNVLSKEPQDSAKINMEAQTQAKYTVEQNSCIMLIVADYRFYKDHSIDLAPPAVIQTLAGNMQMVNSVFQSTVWRGGLTGLGIVLKEMMIYKEPTKDDPDTFNQMRPDWTIDDLIKAFSFEPRIEFSCLAHLFTSIPFMSGTLGYAYMASPDPRVPGGICSVSNYDSRTGKRTYPKVGFTTARHPKGTLLLSLQRSLVTAHEIGHNWGTPHDALKETANEGRRCSPTPSEGGRFLMWPYSVTGNEVNNKYFSPCSIDYISSALSSRPYCFQRKPDEGFCGDGIMSAGEQCDVGMAQDDLCCTTNCLLKNHATCSDFSHECCLKCQISPANTMCEGENLFTCKMTSYCDGRTLRCPHPKAFQDGTPCFNNGECHKGRCKSYCARQEEIKNKSIVSCACEQNVTAACRVCCKEKGINDIYGPCLPTHLKLFFPSSCYLGQCSEAGVCLEQDVQTFAKFFSFFGSLTVNEFANAMKNNIVTFIVILTSLIWIPASIYITREDNIQRERRLAIQKFFQYKMSFLSTRKMSSQVSLGNKSQKQSVHELNPVLPPSDSKQSFEQNSDYFDSDSGSDVDEDIQAAEKETETDVIEDDFAVMTVDNGDIKLTSDTDEEPLHSTSEGDLSSHKHKGNVKTPHSEENTAAQHPSAENSASHSMPFQTRSTQNSTVSIIPLQILSAENNPSKSILSHSLSAENNVTTRKTSVQNQSIENSGNSSKIHFHNSSADNNIVYPSRSDTD